VVVELYALTGEEKFRVAADKIKTGLLTDYPRNADGGFWHGRALPHEMWIDGVFMGLMFLTRYGAVIGEAERCFDEATHQILTLARHCRKGSSGFFYHAYDEAKQVFWADPVTGLSPEVWSEGLGWYALILVETLRVLPVEHKDREAVLQILRELVEGLTKVQDPQTGLWFQVVDRGERADNWNDTSGSAMFVYLIQRAVDLGYVSREHYQPVAKRGYEGLCTKAVVNAMGLIDVVDACDGVCVQSSYRAYVDYPKVVNAKEAVGSVLWAAVAVEKESRKA
jgi:rhamnogalacturonyl hydrolase YesR